MIGPDKVRFLPVNTINLPPSPFNSTALPKVRAVFDCIAPKPEIFRSPEPKAAAFPTTNKPPDTEVPPA